ncbi:alanine racemase [Agromyces silvae]|uniref:alanine racemase n=1 Tax=Agromyces silvae TaxID=3388266 RepID=UPI00280AC063|nr:alanine racemase [Agromyces protaetiae]
MATPIDPILDGADRGFPPASAGIRASEVAAQGWRLHEDFDTPIAVIDAEAGGHNVRLMAAWCATRDAELWPHAKTVMSPQLIRLQLDAGAHGLTAATGQQADLVLSWGAPAVLIANQLVQPRLAARLARRVADSDQRVMSYVDSVASIEILDEAARRAGVVWDVLVELGSPGARTGLRSADDFESLRPALGRAGNLRLVGVAGYEGSISSDRSDDALARADRFLQAQAALLDLLADRGDFATETPVYSAGGSMFFDRVELARRGIRTPNRLVLRSGCYQLHDIGLFAHATPLPPTAEGGGLRSALTVWGTVHSRPEPTLAYLDIGRRDAGTDAGLPQPLRRVPRGATVEEPFTDAETRGLNDQHLHLSIPADSPLAVGDRVGFGISHPCTTMDKWRALAVTDASGAVTGAVTTRF